MVCHGATAALGSIIVGNLIKVTGRIPIILLGASINITLISTMLFLWNADPNHPEFFFIIAGLWGVGNAIWNTQINCEYSLVRDYLERVESFSFPIQRFTGSSSSITKRQASPICGCGSHLVSRSPMLTANFYAFK